MKVLDICVGTGSATQAFRDRGHNVDTLDIAGDHTYVCDVRTFFPEKKYDFIWASPLCTEFSIVDWRKGKCKNRHPDLSIVHSCRRICETAPYWIMENPRGCLRHFIGMPQITINYGDYGYSYKKPTDLWGRFPWFWSGTEKISQKPFQNDALGKSNRACVPYGLSLAICLALESVI